MLQSQALDPIAEQRLVSESFVKPAVCSGHIPDMVQFISLLIVQFISLLIVLFK